MREWWSDWWPVVAIGVIGSMIAGGAAWLIERPARAEAAKCEARGGALVLRAIDGRACVQLVGGGHDGR